MTLTRATQFGAVLLMLGIVLLIGGAGAEDSAAIMIAVLCTGVGCAGIALLHDERDRVILLRLFLAAYALRLVFTTFAFKSGLIDVLGGADDQGWISSYIHSTYWHGWVGNPMGGVQKFATHKLPDSFWDIYNGVAKHNKGYHFYATCFYYLLSVRSHMALAFLNCFSNALTVVFTYKASRDFFSEKASVFVAATAAILPGFLAWSALTIKEPWVILCEIVTFFAVHRMSRDKSIWYGLLAAVMIVVILGFRFYIASVFVVAGALSLVAFRSQRPLSTVSMALAGGALFLFLAQGLGVTHLDLSSIVKSRLEEAADFSTAISTGSHQVRSGVQLGYDVRTPKGAVMMIVVGGAYLLFSPFPWQMGSARQMAALPDVMIWWVLVFFFIVPGITYTWRSRPSVLLSITAFVLPLILLYSIGFGNVGLAYRQRAQLMPFLLILAAAGYESRHLQPRRSAKRALVWRSLLKRRPIAETMGEVPVPS